MGITFNLKVKHRGSTPTTYKGKDGKQVTSLIGSAIENEVLDLEARGIVEAVSVQKERACFLAAVFFQRVCARTPVDEGYRSGGDTYPVQTDGRLHKPDKDYVRDAWKAKCNGRTVSAKKLRTENGIYFESFNNEAEIKAIYEVFRERFLSGKKGSKYTITVNIENTHERFALLEYGGYEADNTYPVPKGEWSDYSGGEGKHFHGLRNGFSVQAPYGMLRITEAEFQRMTLNSSTEQLIKNYVKRSRNVTKVPSKDKIKRLRPLLGKERLSNADIDTVMEVYGE